MRDPSEWGGDVFSAMLTVFVLVGVALVAIYTLGHIAVAILHSFR